MSSHPPGVLLGLVLGHCHRIYTLVSDKTKRRKHFNEFYKRLKMRGYNSSTLLPIQRAANIARDRNNITPMLEENIKVKPKHHYFHLRYHPQDPKSKEIQKNWDKIVAAPPGKTKYDEIINNDGVPLGKSRLIIAYRRAPNLGNLLSSRLIHKTQGPAVSSYLD